MRKQKTRTELHSKLLGQEANLEETTVRYAELDEPKTFVE
jgi:hypothetical protein